MGKFLKYETSNYRTFVIDTTAGTIKRPKRRVTKDDLFGAIIKVDGVIESIVTIVAENTESVVFNMLIDITSENTFARFRYDKATDAFSYTINNTTTPLTNIVIDEFGRELVTLE